MSIRLMKLLANPLSQQAGKWLVMWLDFLQNKTGRKAPRFVCNYPATYTENDEPQPQVVVAFGFLITNCEPSKPSV